MKNKGLIFKKQTSVPVSKEEDRKKEEIHFVQNIKINYI